jgi:hypothetical protein
VPKYLELVADQQDVEIYQYENLEPIVTVRIPCITLNELKTFLGSHGIQEDSANSLLLFAPHKTKRSIPDTQPLRALPITFPKLFYLIAPRKVSYRDFRTVPVLFSEDSYRVSHRKVAFLSKDCTMRALLASIHFPELNRQSKPHRVLLLQNHEITEDITNSQELRLDDFDSGHDMIRVELIPDDQLEATQNDLLQVVQVEIDADGYFTPVKFPFFLNCPPDATLEMVREMIKERLHIPDDSMPRYRFVAFHPRSRWGIADEKLELRNVFKPEAIVRSLPRKPSDLLLMIRPGERSQPRRTAPSLVISN